MVSIKRNVWQSFTGWSHPFSWIIIFSSMVLWAPPSIIVQLLCCVVFYNSCVSGACTSSVRVLHTSALLYEECIIENEALFLQATVKFCLFVCLFSSTTVYMYVYPDLWCVSWNWCTCTCTCTLYVISAASIKVIYWQYELYLP